MDCADRWRCWQCSRGAGSGEADRSGPCLRAAEVQPRSWQEIRHCRRRRGRSCPKCTGGQATKGTKLDSFGHAQLSGIAELLAHRIEEKTGYETRSVSLGHTQRGGTPSAYDRMLATRYGLAALDLVHAGQFGRLVVLRGTEIKSITLAEAISKNRTVDDNFLEILTGLEPAV